LQQLGTKKMRLPTLHAIPTLWAWLRSMLGKSPYSNFGAGVDISAPGGGAAGFCKKPLTRNREAVFWLPPAWQRPTLPVLQL